MNFTIDQQPPASPAQRIRATDRLGAGAEVIGQRRKPGRRDGDVVHVLTAAEGGLLPRIAAHRMWLAEMAKDLRPEQQERLLGLAGTSTQGLPATQHTMAELRRLNLALLAKLDAS